MRSVTAGGVTLYNNGYTTGFQYNTTGKPQTMQFSNGTVRVAGIRWFGTIENFEIMKLKILMMPLLALSMTCCSCDNKQTQPDTPAEPSDCMVRFEKDGSSEYFNVAVRDQYKDYIWYVFRLRHYNDHSAMKYMDLWRIDWAYQGRYDEASGEMENILDKILTDGESECVIKDYGQKRQEHIRAGVDEITDENLCQHQQDICQYGILATLHFLPPVPLFLHHRYC